MPRAWETVRDYLCCRCSSEKRRPHDSAAINNMSENDLDMLIHEEDARAFNNSEHRIICCKSFDFSCWYHDQDENEESGIDTHAEAAPAAGGRAKTGRTAVPAKEEADDGTINPVFEKSKVQKMTIGGDAESGGSGGSAAATDSPKAPKGK